MIYDMMYDMIEGFPLRGGIGGDPVLLRSFLPF